LTSAYAVNGAKVVITGRRGDVLETTASEINAALPADGGKVYP
jgi:NADP-dependent 3-hydroxy acid dehydrogenase YdfG